MKACRFCNNSVKDDDIFCPVCGYDFQTGGMNQAFREKREGKGDKAQGNGKGNISHRQGIDPRIKKFAFVGLGIVLISFGVARFNFRNLASDVTHFFSNFAKIKPSQVWSGKQKNMISLRNFAGRQKSKIYKNGVLLVEGIFFDPNAKGLVTINGKVVAEGEDIEGVTVKKINKSSVEVVINGESKILGVNESLSLFPNN